MSAWILSYSVADRRRSCLPADIVHMLKVVLIAVEWRQADMSLCMTSKRLLLKCWSCRAFLLTEYQNRARYMMGKAQAHRHVSLSIKSIKFTFPAGFILLSTLNDRSIDSLSYLILALMLRCCMACQLMTMMLLLTAHYLFDSWCGFDSIYSDTSASLHWVGCYGNHLLSVYLTLWYISSELTSRKIHEASIKTRKYSMHIATIICRLSRVFNVSRHELLLLLWALLRDQKSLSLLKTASYFTKQISLISFLRFSVLILISLNVFSLLNLTFISSGPMSARC